jgi:hypothetical protein
MPSSLGSGSEAAALTLTSDMESVVSRLSEPGELQFELPPVAVLVSTTPDGPSSPRDTSSAIDEAAASSFSNISGTTSPVGPVESPNVSWFSSDFAID